MKYLPLLALGLFMWGCDSRRQLSNDEIIKESHKCWDAGLMAHVATNDASSPVEVQCLPVERGSRK